MKIKVLGISILLSIMFFSCDKNDESDIVKNSHRIKEIIEFNNDMQYEIKKVFSYDGEEIKEIEVYDKGYSDIFNLNYKIEYTYSNQGVTAEIFKFRDSSLVIDSKIEIGIDNNEIKNEKYYRYVNDQWISVWEHSYEYSGDDLLSYHSMYFSQIDTTTRKGEFFFEDKRVTSCFRYNLTQEKDWSVYDKDTFTYIGNKRDYWIDYITHEKEWLRNLKYTYNYSGDIITSCTRSFWHWEEKWEENFLYTYSYNEYGYLSEYTGLESDYRYSYEEGHGNASLIWLDSENKIFGFPKIKSGQVINCDYTPYFERFLN